MDRNIVYPGAIPLDSDLLTTEVSVMTALGYLAQAALGTGTVCAGLAISQTTTASMTVNIAPGLIAYLTTVDATSFGSLTSNSNPLVKLGINTTTTAITLTAPGTSGQSINYLIEAAFQESDTTAVVLPYYNSANPSQPYSGPANAGTPQNTQRIQRVQLQAKAGTAATTGTQTTPSTDSGFVALYVVTVNYAQTTITSANLSSGNLVNGVASQPALLPSAPLIDGQGLGRGIQPGRLLNIQKITSTSTYVPTPGTNSVVVKLVGGGGGGGGCAGAGSSAYISIGGGGGAGGYAESRLTSGFAGVTVTIGAAGSAGAAGNNSGGAGGTTSFGSALSATGGAGGSGSGTVNAGAIIQSPGTPGVGSGGNLLNSGGDPGTIGQAVSNSFWFSGGGGSTAFGGGGAGQQGSFAGQAGSGYGSGGSGGCALPGSSTSYAGGAGTQGACFVFEYS